MYEFVQQIASLHFVEEVWLFGSRARNDHAPRSDIDIAIVAPCVSSEEWQLLIDTLEGIKTLLKIDCIHFDRLGFDEKLRKNILEQHIVLYTRKGVFMNKLVWQDYFDTLGDAINRLKDAVTHPDLDQNEFLQDATIQRFEFCIELYWKVLRKFLAYEQINALTPREVLKSSYQSGLIDNEAEWISMLTDRNRTSHVYKREEAQRIFENIKTYYPIMYETYNKLKARYDSI